MMQIKITDTEQKQWDQLMSEENSLFALKGFLDKEFKVNARKKDELWEEMRHLYNLDDSKMYYLPKNGYINER